MTSFRSTYEILGPNIQRSIILKIQINLFISVSFKLQSNIIYLSQTMFPSLDNVSLPNGEFERLIALSRTIKLGPIGQFPSVVHHHGLARFRVCGTWKYTVNFMTHREKKIGVTLQTCTIPEPSTPIYTVSLRR